MVEWEDDDLSRLEGDGDGGKKGRWAVRWEGMRDVLAAEGENNNESGHGYQAGGEEENEYTRRVYFLLPPGSCIPPIITLIYLPSSSSSSSASETRYPKLHLHPLPAIFPPEINATGCATGKKGVLHTIWANRRLQSLEREIRAECASNVEGVALHMAIREREWIVGYFGVGCASGGLHSEGVPSMTPVSPGNGKLGEKLKGFKLQTGERELSPSGMLVVPSFRICNSKYKLTNRSKRASSLAAVFRCGCFVVYVGRHV